MLATELDSLGGELRRHFVLLQRPAPDAGVIEDYYRHLKRHSLERVRQALSAYEKRGKFPAKPAEIIDVIDSFDDGEKKPEGPPRCSFEHNGERCPLIGRYDVREGEPKFGRYCPDHHGTRKNHTLGVQILELAIRKQLSVAPAANDVAVARHMMEMVGGEVTVQACYGPAMVRYLRANPAPKSDHVPRGTTPPRRDPRQIGRHLRQPGED